MERPALRSIKKLEKGPIGQNLGRTVKLKAYTDAVQMKVDTPVRINGCGGSPSKGKALRGDPAGFLKVSALSIEGQRVRVTIDFVDPPEVWSSLRHDYRVVVHVTT
ncbi:hypothetical protein [Bradyrhizobium yuanmingense]|uniref:hypothetical protein n=1 Tax=Bradyrhizobium yuanmingense TaxID=108015 RepID=UPI000ABDC05D|nr:hypothetical protein [Bradyrhizobium yuanmingense]